MSKSSANRFRSRPTGTWRSAQAAVSLAFIIASIGVRAESVTEGFTVQQSGDAWWLTKPDGRRFFSLGVCCVNQGADRAAWDPANPSFAAWQHYADSNAWATATLRRLQAWNFTTVGGWSDFEALKAVGPTNIAFAPVLHIGASAGAPWWDMWDPKVVTRLDEVARESIRPFRDDPRVIGYYTDNETGWWNAILFKMTLEQAPGSGQRQRLIQLLRDTYQDNWAALMQDFEPAPILESWAELERHGVLYLRPGGKGIRAERQFLTVLATRYYALVHEAVRKYDSNALILGDRHPSFYYPEVVRACAPYVDVVSCNLNPVWVDGSFPRYQLSTLHALSGKPLIIGEFYMAARENGSGNKNNHGTYPVVATQRERAVGFRRTLESLVALPFIVGADWFQYYDQPTHGRFDGENFNFGLVDIHDRPYAPLVAEASRLKALEAKARARAAQSDPDGAVPPAPRHPLGQFAPGLALKDWDRKQGFVRPTSEFPLADLYVCWNRKAVYLGLCAQDAVEDVYYRGKTVLANERARWDVTLGRHGRSVHGRIGGGIEPVFDEPSVRTVAISGINGNTRIVAALELPARLFGQDHFRRGDMVELSSAFSTHGQAYRTEWKGRLRLAGR